VTNPAQKGQLPRSSIHLAQLSNYCAETSVSTATICHKSLARESPKYTSASPSPSSHIPLPPSEAGTRWVGRDGRHQGPMETGELEDLSLEIQQGRATEAILKES